MLRAFWNGLTKRLLPLIDPTALVFWLVGVGVLAVIDPVMVKTLVEWSLFFFTIAGVVVVVSLLSFPHVDLGEFVAEARRGNVAAAQVVTAIAIFMGLVTIALVMWAKT